jgi:hypothetical protein
LCRLPPPETTDATSTKDPLLDIAALGAAKTAMSAVGFRLKEAVEGAFDAAGTARPFALGAGV